MRSEPGHVLLALAVACITLLLIPATERANAQIPYLGSADSALNPLLLEGQELHTSLRTEALDSISEVPSGMVLPNNPYVSTDTQFIEATARGGSQGRLDGEGMKAALYARYATEKTRIGVYGLEAESEAVANQREDELRDIWAFGASLNRAQVHREDRVLLVVWLWTDEEIPEAWAAVNESLEEMLNKGGKS